MTTQKRPASQVTVPAAAALLFILLWTLMPLAQGSLRIFTPSLKTAAAESEVPADTELPDGAELREEGNSSDTVSEEESRLITKRLISISLGCAGLAAVFVIFAALVKHGSGAPETSDEWDIKAEDEENAVIEEDADNEEDPDNEECPDDTELLTLDAGVEDETIEFIPEAFSGCGVEDKTIELINEDVLE
ncbi:MAG: hypothetical protein IKX06_06220 [Clostridia bacterium]|nr:hypothetical protein [Clostridia bacterium]